MHAVRRIAGIIALFAVIGFSMTACGNGNDNGNGGNSTGSSGLTITNMDAYIGCYIYLVTIYPDYRAADKITFTYNPSTGGSTVNFTPTKITSSTVKLNVWETKGPLENLGAETYTGSGTDFYNVYLFYPEQGGKHISTYVNAKGITRATRTVSFTDGKATLNGNDFDWAYINP